MAALRETAKNLLLLAASLAFTFALLELAFSAYYGPAEFASTPFGVYLHKPGTTYHFSGLTESGEFNTTLKTNSLGFFDGEWATEKSPNSVRFLFLGDSFVEAKQVPQDLSFSALSEALLSESLDGPAKAEVLNFGASAVGTFEEELIYKNLGTRFKHDYVVLFFFPNDLENNYTATVVRKEGLYSLARGIVNNSRFLGTMLRLLPGAPAVAGADLFTGWRRVYAPVIGNEMEHGWGVAFEKILAIKREAEGNGSVFVLSYVPAPFEIEGQYPHEFSREDLEKASFEKPFLKLKEFAEANNVLFLDARTEFVSLVESRSPESFYFPGDGHFNEEGHELYAQVLSRKLAGLVEGLQKEE
ncbi:MAG TPA: SGNH/GDSL hydrolase family protein [archaeon]|nr:SGNH/GDSL hydrolase family protein [archaeon]HLD81466.1 SGNH/GDSL hydrolase family protein [archaeon]